jgi:hypothetical protein
MSGYSRFYVFGGQGGYLGADGVNPIALMILIGDGNRQWLEPLYVDSKLERLGRLNTIAPALPDHPDNLLDACIAFFPCNFEPPRGGAAHLRGAQRLAGGPGADQRNVTAVDGQASPMPAVSRTAACSR